jgi:hypothetical protein
VLKNPANRHRAVALDYEHWKYGFTNTFSEPDSRAAYERCAIPAPAHFLGKRLANLVPGHQGPESTTRTTIASRSSSFPASMTT